MMDTEQRMRIASAIGSLGPDASEMIADLVSSADPIRRKFGVAILNEGALSIASELDCGCRDAQIVADGVE